jgi:SAM-dependent methyltransferase
MDEAEFDRFAEEYNTLLAEHITSSGESPEFFAKYKVAEVARIAKAEANSITNILDFGSGIGSSIPWFRQYFSAATLTCADISSRCLQISRQRFPGSETYVKIDHNQLPLAPSTFDLCFSACVFHHVPEEEHAHWLTELRCVTRPGGLLVIFEHNPRNPLTTKVVNSCPFDANAKLLSASELAERVRAGGWSVAAIRYHIYFPGALAKLRPLERYLQWTSLGAQYCVVARNIASGHVEAARSNDRSNASRTI